MGEALPGIPWPFSKPNSVRIYVPETTLTFPESLYEGVVPPTPVKADTVPPFLARAGATLWVGLRMGMLEGG